jgi:tRNA dimethylallyltransferase
MMKKVLIIVGPTSSGKSDLAVKLAQQFDGEIISADSRQVYRGLDIGSGKITKQEMKDIPHHLLDVAHPKQRFSVAEYKHIATRQLNNIISRGKLPMIVGGTGFYIDVMTGKVSLPNVPPNEKLRATLTLKSAKELFQILTKKDPARAHTIDPLNKIRLVRALEIVEALDHVPPTQSEDATNIEFIYLGLRPDNLHERIDQRLLSRMNGIINEVKKLHQKGLSWKRFYELGLEYRYVSLYLQKKLTKSEMLKQLSQASRHYAKRQMTWFKRNKEIQWFQPEEFQTIAKYIQSRL